MAALASASQNLSKPFAGASADLERLVAIDGLVRTALRYLLDSILEAARQDVAISAGIEALVLRPLLRQVH